MTTISTKKQFLTWLSSDPDFEKKQYEKKYCRPHSQMFHLKGTTLTGLSINERDFESIEFKNCIFDKCEFYFCIFSSCTFINCQFVNCRFTWSKFLDLDLFSCLFESCIILGLELSDVIFRDSLFKDCSEILDLIIRGDRDRKITFQNCYLHFLDIEPIGENCEEKIDFIECILAESSFDRVDFSSSFFSDCSLSLCQFTSCSFSRNTFNANNQTPGNEYNMIDIRTIINSAPLDPYNLSSLFGIQNSDIKEYLIGLTTKIEFQSIFISYSFEDHKFAKLINEELSRRGILTFLWEKDSPGGKQLEHIMSDSVKDKDRVLFIASADSLKSTACHFELSEGRKKQEKIWQDVLFPIHIDNFLFEVKKEIIRPINSQEEYWQNILELRRLNSLSFEAFTKVESRDTLQFEKQLFRLIKGLRKNN